MTGKDNYLNLLWLSWNQIKCFFKACILYSYDGDILEVEDTVLTFKNILVWLGGFTIHRKSPLLESNILDIKSWLKQFLAVFWTSCIFLRLRVFTWKNQDKIPYFSGLLLYFSHPFFIGFCMLIYNPSKRACSVNIYTRSIVYLALHICACWFHHAQLFHSCVSIGDYQG